MTTNIKELPLHSLIPPWSMLRPVRETTLEYMEMVDSIREHGLLKSILVRPHPTREGEYEIIDGMWRYFSCKELDIPEIPCIIKVVVSDEEFLALQIQSNAVSYETRPVEFAEQMQRMLQIRGQAGAPMTLVELAGIVGKSSGWVSTRLRLLTLCDEGKQAVRDGKLGLGKAIALSRIRLISYQQEFLAKSFDMKTRDFELEVGKFIAEKRSIKMGKRRAERNEIDLKPRLQSMDSLLIELDRTENISQIIVQRGLTTAIEGAKLALEWVLNLHKEGREEQVKEIRHILSLGDRKEILGRQRYEELKELRELKETRDKEKRQAFE